MEASFDASGILYRVWDNQSVMESYRGTNTYALRQSPTDILTQMHTHCCTIIVERERGSLSTNGDPVQMQGLDQEVRFAGDMWKRNAGTLTGLWSYIGCRIPPQVTSHRSFNLLVYGAFVGIIATQFCRLSCMAPFCSCWSQWQNFCWLLEYRVRLSLSCGQ